MPIRPPQGAGEHHRRKSRLPSRLRDPDQPDRVPHDPPVLRQHIGVPNTEALDQTRRPLDIGKQEGDGTGRKIWRGGHRSNMARRQSVGKLSRKPSAGARQSCLLRVTRHPLPDERRRHFRADVVLPALRSQAIAGTRALVRTLPLVPLQLASDFLSELIARDHIHRSHPSISSRTTRRRDHRQHELVPDGSVDDFARCPSRSRSAGPLGRARTTGRTQRGPSNWTARARDFELCASPRSPSGTISTASAVAARAEINHGGLFARNIVAPHAKCRNGGPHRVRRARRCRKEPG